MTDRIAWGSTRSARVQWLRAIDVHVIAMCTLLAGCSSSRYTLTPDSAERPREAALEAEQASDWRLAAERWYAVMLKDRDAVEPCLRTARALLRTNDADDANHVIDLGLETHPDDADLCELKGDALVILGFRRPAEHYYMRVLKADPKRTSALVALSKARIDLGWESAAVGPLTQAIEITGGDHESWYLLGIAQRRAGQPTAAFDAYVKAFANDAGTADELVTAATLPLAEVLRRAHPDAGTVMLGWLERAVQRDPKNATAYFMTGVLSEDLGRRHDAVVDYRRAIDIDANCLMSLRNLAALYASMGDEVKTRDTVARSLALEEDPERRQALARLLEQFQPKTAARTKSER